MGYALSVIVTSLQILGCSRLFDVFFERRYSGKKFYALLALWMAVAVLEVNVQQNSIGVLLFVSEIAVFYMMNVTLYKGHWERRLFVTVTQYAIAFSISYLTQLFFVLTLSISWEELVSRKALYTVILFISLIQWFVFPVVLQHFHPPLSERTKPRAWVSLGVFFPVCTLFILFMSKIGDPANTAWPICLVVMSVVDISALFLLDQLESSIQMREMLAVARQRAETQASSIKALTDSYSAQRRLTHDFRKYLFTLSNMLTQGKIEDAKNYLEKLKVQQTERILLVNSHHAAIDAILNQAGYMAQSKNIEIQFVLNDLSKVRIPVLDLTVVMSNLLDNAIEGCERLPDGQKRWISVNAIYTEAQPSSLFFLVANSSLPFTITGDHLPSTKHPAELHGYGLPNVLSILKSYNAEYTMLCENGHFSFAVDWPDTTLDDDNSKAPVALQAP